MTPNFKLVAAECPFCQMVNKFTTARVFDIEPLNPVVPGHRLIIPAEHVSNFSDNPDLTAEVMKYAAEYAKRHGIDCNLITSKGTPATQTVFHLHVHIIPRREGDGLLLPWTGQAALLSTRLAALEEAREAVFKDACRVEKELACDNHCCPKALSNIDRLISASKETL